MRTISARCRASAASPSPADICRRIVVLPVCAGLSLVRGEGMGGSGLVSTAIDSGEGVGWERLSVAIPSFWLAVRTRPIGFVGGCSLTPLRGDGALDPLPLDVKRLIAVVHSPTSSALRPWRYSVRPGICSANKKSFRPSMPHVLPTSASVIEKAPFSF